MNQNRSPTRKACDFHGKRAVATTFTLMDPHLRVFLLYTVACRSLASLRPMMVKLSSQVHDVPPDLIAGVVIFSEPSSNTT